MSLEEKYPYVEVKNPKGDKSIISLEAICLGEYEYFTIGRSERNHLVIEDPQKFISREHCRIKKEGEYVWIIDDASGSSGKPSASGTFLRCAMGGNDLDVRSEGRLRLQQGDTFYFIGELVDDRPLFWEFTFHDPSSTLGIEDYIPSKSSTPQKNNPLVGDIVYSLEYSRPLRYTGQGWEIINLSGQLAALLNCMARKNADKGTPRLCTYEELKKAVWGDTNLNRTNSEINTLIYRIRQKIESDPSEPQYIKNLKTDGYVLYMNFLDNSQ